MAAKGKTRRKAAAASFADFEAAEIVPAKRSRNIIDEFVASGNESMRAVYPTDQEATRAAAHVNRACHRYMALRDPEEPAVRTAKRGREVWIFLAKEADGHEA